MSQHNHKLMSSDKGSEEGSPVFIEKETIKRLLNDIKDLVTSPLDSEGIYYRHSETDMLTGYAMIVGPADSLYFGGYFFFKFIFPTNYPHSPPVVQYLTNDGSTRFHPNLYVNKKVCLSILNTWRGDTWTGCQSIRSVLMTILSILDSEPLLHEPGVTIQHPHYNSYNKIVTYKTLRIAICELIISFQKYIGDIEYNDYFYQVMVERFIANKDKIYEVIMKNKETTPEDAKYTVDMYSMRNVTLSYVFLEERFKQVVELTCK